MRRAAWGWILWGASMAAGCGASDHRPAIKNLPFEIAPVVSGKAGDLDFSKEVSQNKVLLEFAGNLIDGGTGPSGKILPHITVFLAPTVTIRAAAEGYVVAVEKNTDSTVANDYEIRVEAKAGSRWVVSYDHVASPVVEVGQTIEAGAALGVGIASKKFEFDIYDSKDGNRRYCPSLFYDWTVKSTLEAKFTRLFADWESHKGNTTIYDEASMFAPGCAVESY